MYTNEVVQDLIHFQLDTFFNNHKLVIIEIHNLNITKQITPASDGEGLLHSNILFF